MSTGQPPREGIERDESGNFVVRHQECPECGESYIFRSSHLATSERHALWLKGMIQEEIVHEPPIVESKYSRETRPEKIVFGVSKPCPRCNGVLKLRKIPKTLEPCQCPKEEHKRPGPCRVHILDTVTMDPHKSSQICPRCDGMGIVPA